MEVDNPPLSHVTVQTEPFEKDGAAHFDLDDHVERGQNKPEENNEPLVDYHLVRDRARRVIKPNNKFAYADVISFALCTGQELKNAYPRVEKC